MKKIRYFRIIALALLCSAVTLAACADNAGDSVNEPANPAENIQGGNGGVDDAHSDAPAGSAHNLPDADMGGKEFRILTSGWFSSGPTEDIAPEESTGDPLDDAAYSRKIKIEETYNCKIIQIGGAGSPSEHAGMLQTSVRAGDPAYEVALIHGYGFAGLLTRGYLLDLDELEHVDYENPWWQQNMSDALLIGGNRYGVSGNISSSEIGSATAICFNKGMIQDHGFESPYDIVKAGNWTFDKLMEMSRAAARDLDGGGVTDSSVWGMIYNRDSIWNLLNAFGIKLIENDSEGLPQVVIDSGENVSRIQNVFTQLLDQSHVGNWRIVPELEGGWGTDAFANGRALFLFQGVGGIVNLRTIDRDFGIIPLPKYDLSQRDYMPNVYGLGTPIICVPSTNTDFENTGIFLEAFSYEGSKTIIPAFYENLLKTKAARDDESEEMLDFIFGNLHYDMGTLINFDGFTQQIAFLTEDRNVNIASFVERNKPRLERSLQRIVDELS